MENLATPENNSKFVINSPDIKSAKNIEALSTFKRKKQRPSLTGWAFKNSKMDKLFTKSSKNLSHFYKTNRRSIVYQLPNTGDSRSKDYDKISGDIKKVEITIRKENELKRKKSPDYLENNNINESSSSEVNTIEEEINKKNNINIEKYNILEVIQKFKVSPENRTVEDLYITKNFLHQTKLIEFYEKELNNDKKMIENLTTFFGLEFQYQKFQKGEAIYKVDNYPDNFYLVLLGKVDLLKVEPKVVNMTGYEYFCYIMNLRKNNENYRYKLCLEENKDIYWISPDEENLLPYFFLKFIIDDIKEGKQIDDFSKILELIDIKPKELGLAEDKLNSMEYILNSEKRIIKKIANYSKDKIKDYKFINNRIVKRYLKLYEYARQKTIEPLNYFGDEEIESNTPRKETALCLETTEVVFLLNKLYINNILPKKALILERKTAFLSKNYLFDKIPPKKFVKRYFPKFVLETYNKGDVLFNETDIVDYVYFIKEGNVKLTTSKSILEMEMLINEINKKIKIVQNIYNSQDNNNEEENISFLYNNIKSTSPELVDHIQKREHIKIFILKESEDAGLESYFLGLNHFMTGIVDSPIAKIYKISKKDLTDLLNKERFCFYEMINRVEDKLKLLNERFYQINNIKISMTDQKITEENNIKYGVDKSKEESYTDLIPNKNDIKINVDKIKEVINIKNNIKYKNYKNSKNLMLTLPDLYSKHTFTNSPKKGKDYAIKNIKTSFNKKTKKSFFLSEQQINKRKKFLAHKLSLKERVKKLLYYKKNFLYEDEFLSKLAEDMNDLLENKLFMTKKVKNDDVCLTTTYRDNIGEENLNDNMDNKEDNGNQDKVKNNLLITQIENFNKNIKANHFFTQTGNKFNIKNKNNLSRQLNNKSIYSSITNKEEDLINSNYRKINTINNSSTFQTQKNEIIDKNAYIKSLNITRNKKIKSPYVSPLTLIKLQRYKMIDEIDKYKENKKRYEDSIKKLYEKRGLNQFGYPLSYNNTFIRKGKDINIKK